MADFEVTGTVTLDADDMLESIEEILDKLDEFSDKVGELDAELDDLEDHTISLEIDIINEDKLEELKLFLDDIESHIYEIELLINTDDAEIKMEDLRLDLEDLTDLPHEIDLNISDASIADSTAKIEALRTEIDALNRSEENASKSSSDFEFSLKMLAPLAIPASAGILALVGGIGGLASAFGTMIPPVALAAYGIDQLYTSISTLYTGLNAATQAALMNATTFNQTRDILDKNSSAFRSMSASVQDAVVQYTMLKREMDIFKGDLQPGAALDLANAFNLIGTALSMMVDPADEAETAISRLLVDFTEKLHDSTFQTFFADMDENISTLVMDWGGGIENIVEGIVALLNAFMPLSMDISGGFLHMTQTFDTWAQHLGSSAGWHTFVQTVETDGPKILGVLGDLVRIITHIVTALGEQSGNTKFFTDLESLLGKLSNTTGADQGMTALTGDLVLFGLAASKIGPALGPLLSFLVTPEGAAIAAIIALGAGFLYAYKNVQSFHDYITKNFGPAISSLGGDIKQFEQWMVSIWPEIQEVWTKYGKNITAIISSDFSAILSIIGGLLKVIEGIIDLVLGILTGNWSQAWHGVELIFEGIWEAIIGLLKYYTTTITNVIGGFNTLVKTDWHSAWNDIKKDAGEMLGVIWTVISSGWNEVVSGTAAAGTRMVVAVVNFLASVVGYFTRIPGELLTALGNLGNLLYNAGAEVVDGLINGIESKFNDVESTLSTLTSWLPSWKGPASTDAALLVSSGQLVIQGFINGLESKYSAVKASLQGLTNDLGNNMSKQISTNLTAKINSSLKSTTGGVSGALPGSGGAGNTGNSGQTQVVFAAGSIQITNPSQENPGTSLTRTMQAISKFGSIQTPVGMSTG
jgi:hypothetical protein